VLALNEIILVALFNWGICYLIYKANTIRLAMLPDYVMKLRVD
jgi:hypothetical protein